MFENHRHYSWGFKLNANFFFQVAQNKAKHKQNLNQQKITFLIEKDCIEFLCNAAPKELIRAKQIGLEELERLVHSYR